MTISGPIPDSYWVVPGRLLAGEYPGALLEVKARAKVQLMLAAGITLFLDLTEEGELEPYAHFLGDPAQQSAKHCRVAIRDLGVPTRATMSHILATIDHAIESGEVVYVHCWGGVGRTGTVVGCYLVRHGMSGSDALEHIKHLRDGTPDGWKRSPETDAQQRMVLNWPRGQGDWQT
jgi:protein-tyrosine phosphatase